MKTIIIDSKRFELLRFEVRADPIDVTNQLPRVEPDLSWACIDSAGHFHAWDTVTRRLPTLEQTPCLIEHCDGACSSGHLRQCKICRELIEPGYVTTPPDRARRYIAGPETWEFEVRTIARYADLPAQLVTARTGNRFGIAVRTTLDREGDAFTITYQGEGPWSRYTQ